MITSKLPNTGTTIFTVMSALAQKHGAINLAQGFPGFTCSPALLESAYGHMKTGQNQYAPMAGVLALREQLSLKYQRLYNKTYDIQTEITVTAGATEAVYTAITALVSAGDEVIIFDPAFDIYRPAIELCGAKAIAVKLEYPHYEIDWNEVEKKCNAKTKLIILNSPHNPTGAVMDERDIVALRALTQKFGFYILSDEVYEHIIFDGKKHLSMALYDDLAARSLIIGSLGKTYHVTGWRVGYCIAPAELTDEFRKVHQSVTFAAATPLQLALADSLKDADSYESLPLFFEKKRDLFLNALKGSIWEFQPSGGTYFQLVRFPKSFKKSDTEVAKWLTESIGVASIPISGFYDDETDAQVLRFCFAKEDSTLLEAAARLCRI